MIIGGLAAFIFLFARFAPKEWSKNVYKAVAWLIEIIFLFFVDIVIFLKPLKKHRKKVGFIIWLIFVFIVGRYLIAEQPLITEIQPHFLPFIGYIYFLSVLYIIEVILNHMLKNEVATG